MDLDSTDSLSRNPATRAFRSLVSVWQHGDATSQTVDALLAELASSAAGGEKVCLGMVRKEAVPRLFWLVFLLNPYGMALKQVYRQRGDGVWLYLERNSERVSEFAGSRVTTRDATVVLPRPA